MAKKWIRRKPISQKISDCLINYPEIIRTLLFYRGIQSVDEAEIYLNPDYERDLHDPFLLTDMAQAVERIIKAIEQKEKIIIFGDYDTDGVCGTVIIEEFFRRIGYNDFDVYIPDRHLEAYGLSEKVVEQFAADKVKLIITVDCGITDVKEIALAGKKNIDVIVTDHHLIADKLPPAYAIVDAKRPDDQYPFKMLAGAAVAFKLVQAILAKERFNVPVGWEKWLLDLVAVATISDMVPLEGENRTLTHYGLRVLRQTHRVGFQALLGVLKIKPEFVMEDDISFMVGPRLNSASRMSHASQAYFLLRTHDDVEATTLALHLEEKNTERREAVEEILRQIDAQFINQELPAVIVAGRPTWNLGVLGLTANRLAEKYNRPIFLWSQNSNGEIKGSGRSDGSVNLVELMAVAGGRSYFKDFGGHAMASGFSLVAGQEKFLAEKLLTAHDQVEKIAVETAIKIDSELSFNEVTWDTYYQIEKLGPFGMDNPKPVFLFKSAEIIKARTFGNGGIHLEVVFQGGQGQVIPAVGFFTCPPSIIKEKFDTKNGHNFSDVDLSPGSRVDLLANLEKSTFKNYPELRLRIVDLKKPE